MLLEFDNFRGEIPILDASKLPAGVAENAANTRLENGTLTATRTRQFVTDLVTPRESIYLHQGGWLAWDFPAYAVPGPIADDRLYVVGDGTPNLRLPNGDAYPLKLPAPTVAPSVSNQTGHDPDNFDDVQYAYTFVTFLDEESPPSPLARVSYTFDDTIRLSGFQSRAFRGVDRLRIYRSQTSNIGTTDLYFVDEIPVSSTEYIHQEGLDPLGGPITTKTYDEPRDGMDGLISMPNGMMVAFEGRRLLFCEPYLPHAWPTNYELTVDFNIVGLVAFGSQLAILTEGYPYRGQGLHPADFALERIEQDMPCVSRRGIVDMGYSAVYPSTNGLVMISPTNATVISEGLFTREQWRNLGPETIIAGRDADRYIMSTDNPVPRGDSNTVIVDLGQQPSITRVFIDPLAFYHDFRTGTLYYQSQSDNQLYAWDRPGQSKASQFWESGTADLPYPISFSCVEVQGESFEPGDFQMQILADDEVLHTITSLNSIERLPTKKTDRWKVRVIGQATVRSIKMGTSLAELAKGRQ